MTSEPPAATDSTPTSTVDDRVRGVLGGGALGAALQHSRPGQSSGASAPTSLTLYVLDGLLEWIEWANDGQMADPAATVWLALLRWHRAQTGAFPDGAPEPLDRWIDTAGSLRSEPTSAWVQESLSGLDRPDMGLPQDPSAPEESGCGALVRSAPYGMIPRLEDHHVVSLARQGAVLSHGHPAAWTSSAALALMISQLMGGGSLRHAAEAAVDWLGSLPASQPDGGTGAALQAALDGGSPAVSDPLGSETALALAVAAVLSTQDTPGTAAEHLSRALTASGTTDPAVGVVIGQLLGAHHGTALWSGGADATGFPTELPERALLQDAAERWIAATG